VETPEEAATAEEPAPRVKASCSGEPLTVTFYDAGQALASLVTLPDGQRILIDAGEDPARAGCGAACRSWHERVVNGLEHDLDGDDIDLVWITHQHSDHHGGLPGIARGVKIVHYVDNGQSLDKPGVQRARKAAKAAGATLSEVKPGKTAIPLSTSDDVQLAAVVPDTWSTSCEEHPNDCSIGLLVTYCNSTILFTGDGELKAENAWSVEDIDLLQVGHHGSDTSSSIKFITKIKPDYAVISCGRRGEGTNRTYCHPRKSTVERIAQATGGTGSVAVVAFDAERGCRQQENDNWDETVTGDRLWITARDGTVTLTTTGNGDFSRNE